MKSLWHTNDSTTGRLRLTRRHAILIAALTVGAGTLGFLTGSDSDYFYRVKQSIETFGRVYQEITANYVDQVDPGEFMRAGIDGMLRTLDPYTVFIGENEGDELDLVTNGKYGGVGVSIGIRDGAITVLNLIEGYSAAKQGVQIGDRILTIDGKPTTGLSLEGVRQLVRGAPGTEVRITVEREDEKRPLEFVLLREEIPVRNVTYSGFVAPGIGLIRLERFSRTAGDDVRGALKGLEAQQKLRGVILDLRDNPGGLLDVAVDVVAKFVPESSLVVSTRGRRPDSERRYYSDETPMEPDVPLAVLVNRSTASASEIVAGAVQDLDRGVIVGTRTFGKGLVQTIARISETASLKLTTARYYTPSGRCIQEIDYWHRKDDGSVTTVPDSLRKEFRTRRNRPVWEAGGIQPDTAVTDTMRNAYLDELLRKAMFFTYANRFAAIHKTLPDDFTVSDSLVNDFESYLKEKGFAYEEEGATKVKELRELAARDRYGKEFAATLDRLDRIIASEEQHQINRFREEVRIALRAEILGRIVGDRARAEATFASDRQLQTALHILQLRSVYDTLLAPRK